MDHDKLFAAGAPKADDGSLIIHDCCDRPPEFTDGVIECAECGRMAMSPMTDTRSLVGLIFMWNREIKPDECRATGCPCLDMERTRGELRRAGRDIPAYILQLLPAGK